MGARQLQTRTKEYASLMWNTLSERYPKALSRFNEFYSVLSYKTGWDWIKDGPGVRPFDSLPVMIRAAIVTEFCLEFEVWEAKKVEHPSYFENLLERSFFCSFEELETKLINQPV